MSFVRFEDTGSRMGDPFVSIWSRGQIGFNLGAAQEYNLKNYGYVVLYFDPDTRRIGFELTNDKNEKGAVKLMFRAKSGASFSAIPFLRTHKISFKQTQKYNLTKDNTSGLLVIDLNNPKK